MIPFAEIIGQLDVGLMFVDGDGQIMYCNEAEARARGASGRLSPGSGTVIRLGCTACAPEASSTSSSGSPRSSARAGPATAPTTAAARRRIQLRCARWTSANPDLPLSFGIGWEVARSAAELDDAFESADRAMYRDKQQVKNGLRCRWE